MKHCTKCKIQKDLADYHKDKNTNDDHTYWCKLCNNARSREHRSQNLHQRKATWKVYYATNRERLKQSSKAWRDSNLEIAKATQRARRQRLRMAALNRYSHNDPKCVCCLEKRLEFLAIDHIAGGGNEHRREVGEGANFFVWLRDNNYPEGFRVLCYNCNNARGLYGYCPHEKERNQCPPL